MTSPFARGGDPGSPTFGHALLSSGDELPEATLSQKRRFSGRRKALKLRKAKARNSARLKTANDSDASVEDGEVNADDGAALDSSESDVDKPKVYAPSGATRKSAMAKYKLKSRPLKTPIRQAGHNKSSSLSPKAVRLPPPSSPYRTRTSEKVRFDLENVAKRSPTPVADSCYAPGNLTDDLDTGSDNDDSVYDKLNLISDSDPEEEDDDAIEDMETQYLIEHLEATGELAEESAFSDLYNQLEESAQIDNTESEDLDNYFVIPTTELSQNHDASVTSEHSPILGASSSTEMENAIDLLPMSGLRTASFKLEPTETGLQTPSSLPQSIIMRDYDDEETDLEEPNVGSVSGARLKRLSGYGAAAAATPTRVRKNSKPKTPKRGSFKIPKKDTVIKHSNGELVISRRGKIAASGTITPKGVLTSDSPRVKPIGIPMAEPYMQAITAPPSALTSPTTDGTFFSGFSLQESPILNSDIAGFGPSPEQQADELFKDFIVVKNDA